MNKYKALGPVKSKINKGEWTFQFKTPTARTCVYEEVVPGRTYKTREVAKAEMVAFIDEQNLGMGIS